MSEFNLSEKIWNTVTVIDSKIKGKPEGSIDTKDVKEFIKQNNNIDNELADEIFGLQERGERIDIQLLIENTKKKRNKLAGEKLK